MILTADYHTHTPYSHGKNTVLENALAAKEKGLKAIGITDHGYSHIFFGLRRKKVPFLQAECRAAQEKTGVKVLVGMEANIRGESGLTDITDKDYDDFDLFVAGKHVCVTYATPGDFRRYFWGNLIQDKFKKGKNPPEKLVEYNTRAYINAIKNNPVDIISHLGYKCPCNVAEVAKCARDYGTYIELNSKKRHLTDEELAAVCDTGVRFVLDSDAHSASRVGDFAPAEEQIQRVGVPLDRIDNINGREPAFRFAAFKNGR
ncbi:MAG: PHP domain-containing protein [Candidatus Borkfalkiaceae bacterium]|nr:PHP domain-containing protein [Clostridia bacterium]MDY6222944.1 PHP domain-containing protein [Christensenellaceae bacterium]